jgi:hypothetical protein
MCSRPSNPKGFYALNRAEDPSLYPRGVHPGVDFFVPEVNSVSVVSMSDGIVAGIAIGKPRVSANNAFNIISDQLTHNI